MPANESGIHGAAGERLGDGDAEVDARVHLITPSARARSAPYPNRVAPRGQGPRPTGARLTDSRG
jgi:hypothetical protein